MKYILLLFFQPGLGIRTPSGLKNNLSDITPTSQQRWPKRQTNSYKTDSVISPHTYWRWLTRKKQLPASETKSKLCSVYIFDKRICVELRVSLFFFLPPPLRHQYSICLPNCLVKWHGRKRQRVCKYPNSQMSNETQYRAKCCPRRWMAVSISIPEDMENKPY